MGINIGIDLGTTYSCCAYVDKQGRINIINNAEGELFTPSVVFINNGDVTVGSTARQEGGLVPENIIERSKNHMGEEGYTIYCDGKEYSPAAIAKFILEKLKNDCEKALGEKISGAIVTCPAYFGDHARAATKLAAEKAGIKVISILDEPTAACLAYGYSKNENLNKQVILYDLGGGTFDVTVMRLIFRGDKKDMEVITTAGDHLLGGKDWDAALKDYVINEFCALTGFTPDDLRYDFDTASYLSEHIELTKKTLTSKETASITVSFKGEKEKIEVKREDFEQMTENLLSQTVMLINDMLSKKKISMRDIDEIVLVGGSTRMPQVKKRLVKEYGKPVYSYEPDKAVAMGAALMASYSGLKKDTGKMKLSGSGAMDALTIGGTTSFKDVHGTEYNVKIKCTKSYGELTYRWGSDETYITNIVYKDTEKPCKRTVDFYTRVDNQTSVYLDIFEDDSLEKEVDLQFGKQMYERVEVRFPYALEKDHRFDETLIVDENGMLHVFITVDGIPSEVVDLKRIGYETNLLGLE